MLRKIFYIINIVCVVALLLTYIPAFVPEDMFSRISLLSLLYPYLLTINACFIVFWIFVRPRNLIIPLLAIIIRVDYVPRFVNISTTDYKTSNDIKVLSYNVCDFRNKVYNNDSELIKENQDSILAYIRSTNADIVCLQDYSGSQKDTNGFHYKMMNSLGYKHFFTYPNDSSSIRNTAIYSKYHINNADCFFKEDTDYYEFIYADIRTPKKLIRVYNVHLVSYMLGPEEKARYSKIKQGDIKMDTGSKKIVNKLVVANKKRNAQIEKIMPFISNTSLPYLIVGDFNDNPFSYTYSFMTKNLGDSFVAKGKKVGRTYNGVFPAYRIDYLLYQKKYFVIHDYQSPALNYSDHYPICITLSTKSL
jgi:endonuclease/exonuclease/phosphatase family metal-dependent hydrolase